MKTLLILRHAKSSWDEPGISDHDRPLNKRGKRAAPRMGELLAAEDLVPDFIMCSTAKRARQTASLVADAAGFDGTIEYRDDLYHASPVAYLHAVSEAAKKIDCLMIVGHNPGMESLVSDIGGTYERFPTAALAQVEFDVKRWSKVKTSNGRVVNLWRPKEL